MDTKAAAEKVPIKTSRARLDKTLAVKREYARFEDKTFVRGGLELRCTDGRWLVLDLFESGTGESEKVLSSVGTQVSIFAKCPEKSPVLNLLLHRDGEVVRLSVKTEYADDGMFLCYIQRPDLEQIAAAETVEAKWWTYEGKLTPDSLVRLREFMQYLF